MKKTIKTYKNLPFEVGKTYQTKFSTGWKFLVKEVIYKEIKVDGGFQKKETEARGIYENSPHLGICPLNIERLIPDRVENGEIEICGNCGELI